TAAAKDQALAAVARAFGRLGEAAAAREAAAEIGRAEFKLKAAVEAAKADVRSGREADALKSVDALTADADRVYALHQIAVVQARAGNRDGAKAGLKRAVELIGTGPAQLQAHNVASAQALI